MGAGLLLRPESAPPISSSVVETDVATGEEYFSPTVADLLERIQQLDDIPFSRTLASPLPGTATEAVVAGAIIELLRAYVRKNRLGVVASSDGTIRFMPGMVRVPDAAFVSHQRLGTSPNPRRPIPNLVPDLTVEVLSFLNTAGKMQRKRRDYFSQGVRTHWEVDRRPVPFASFPMLRLTSR